MADEGVGPWCENAIQYPAWGPIATPDRIEGLIALSAALAEAGSFLALETFYNEGLNDPSPEEVLFYWAAYQIFRHGEDALVLKPDWNPYGPMREVLWFDIFGLDIGEPVGEAAQDADGVFHRDFERGDGRTARVYVRADGGIGGSVSASLSGDWCRVDVDGAKTALAGDLALESGDGVLLVEPTDGLCAGDS
ncbi:MAG: putative glycoside hydrolase family 15 protein [Deltaproteobacteria bacterium]|nr:putative glycoside hydrolase family 15 protein [Deltaproteobacteria bacterium]